MGLETLQKNIQEAKALEFAAEAWFDCERDYYAATHNFSESKRKWLEAIIELIKFID